MPDADGPVLRISFLMIPEMVSAAKRRVDESSPRSLALSLEPAKRNARASEWG